MKSRKKDERDIQAWAIIVPGLIFSPKAMRNEIIPLKTRREISHVNWNKN